MSPSHSTVIDPHIDFVDVIQIPLARIARSRRRCAVVINAASVLLRSQVSSEFCWSMLDRVS
jgi:hypothetical protein